MSVLLIKLDLPKTRQISIGTKIGPIHRIFICPPGANVSSNDNPFGQSMEQLNLLNVLVPSLSNTCRIEHLSNRYLLIDLAEAHRHDTIIINGRHFLAYHQSILDRYSTYILIIQIKHVNLDIMNIDSQETPVPAIQSVSEHDFSTNLL